MLATGVPLLGGGSGIKVLLASFRCPCPPAAFVRAKAREPSRERLRNTRKETPFACTFALGLGMVHEKFLRLKEALMGDRYLEKMKAFTRTPGLQQERMEDLLRRTKRFPADC